MFSARLDIASLQLVVDYAFGNCSNFGGTCGHRLLCGKGGQAFALPFSRALEAH